MNAVALWIPLLAFSVLSAYAVARVASRSAPGVLLDNRAISAAVAASVAVVLLLSSQDEPAFPLGVFGLHMASLWMSVALLASSACLGKGGCFAAAVAGAVSLATLIMAYAGAMSFYHANTVAIVVSAAAILFGSGKLPAYEAPAISWRSATIAFLALAASMASLWAGAVILGSEVSAYQYAQVQFSAFAFSAIEIWLVFRVHRRSPSQAVGLALDLMALDMAAGFLLGVAAWHRSRRRSARSPSSLLWRCFWSSWRPPPSLRG